MIEVKRVGEENMFNKNNSREPKQAVEVCIENVSLGGGPRARC